MPWWTEDDAGSIGDAARGMGGVIPGCQVRFGFDNASGRFSVRDDFAEQGARDVDGRTGVKRSRERVFHNYFRGRKTTCSTLGC